MLSFPRYRLSPVLVALAWLVIVPAALYLIDATGAESAREASPSPLTVPPSPPSTLDENSIRLLFIGMGIAVVTGLIGVLKTALDIFKFFRADPPLHAVYATKDEMAAAEKRLAQRIERAEQDQEKHLTGIYDELRTLNRALGFVEGQTKTNPKR